MKIKVKSIVNDLDTMSYTTYPTLKLYVLSISPLCSNHKINIL